MLVIFKKIFLFESYLGCFVKIVSLFFVLNTFVSCSSTPQERKPFMIVGKVEQPTHSAIALSLGYGLGSSQFKGDELKTKYSSFEVINLGTSLAIGIWNGSWAFGFGGSYLYSFYDKSKVDAKSNELTLESFRSSTYRGFISSYTNLVNFNRSSIGLSLIFYPYSKTNFNKVATLSTKQAKLNGVGYGATININSLLIGMGLSYRKNLFQKKLSEDQFLIEFGTGIGKRLN